MVFRLCEEHIFPDPALANEDGLLAIGGDLDPARIIKAYHQGIFPWFSRGCPIMWWSPDPRLVLFPDQLKISRSLKQTLNSKKYSVTFNKCFKEVLSLCANTPRKGQQGTWITPGMKKAYYSLHKLGFAHSVETWKDGTLAGGLYGLAISKVFFGESMFSLEKDASKVALALLVEELKKNNYSLIDCQMSTAHLISMGAVEIKREEYLELLKRYLSEK